MPAAGSLSYDELRRAVRTEGKLAKRDFSDDELQQLFEHIDKDRSGEVGMQEFLAFIDGETMEDNTAAESDQSPTEQAMVCPCPHSSCACSTPTHD